MASKAILTNINLNKNELQNAVIQPLAAAPASPKLGQIYVNTGDNLLYIYNGTAWTAVGAVVSVNGKAGVVVLTQDDVGDGSTYKRTHNDLTDALVALINGALQRSGGTMSGAIAMGSNRITGLGAPTADSDASTKKYVDDAVSGLGAVLEFKGTVATTAALPLTGNEKGDVYIVTEDNSEWVWVSDSASGTAADWEKFGPTIDLSGYATIAYVDDAIAGASVKTATGTIGTSATSATVSYSGTLINAYATMGGSEVVVDIAYGSGTVTFSTAQAPSSAITCVVVYA